MGVSGKLSVEMEIKSPAVKYFNGFVDHGALLSKALPDGLHKSKVHEGDGKSLNSVNHYTYVLDGKTVVSRGKMEVIDEKNKFFTLNAFDGYINERYSKYKIHVQVFTKDGKDHVNCTMEYEKLSEEVPEPINYLEFATKFAKGLDAHLLQA